MNPLPPATPPPAPRTPPPEPRTPSPLPKTPPSRQKRDARIAALLPKVHCVGNWYWHHNFPIISSEEGMRRVAADAIVRYIEEGGTSFSLGKVTRVKVIKGLHQREGKRLYHFTVRILTKGSGYQGARHIYTFESRTAGGLLFGGLSRSHPGLSGQFVLSPQKPGRQRFIGSRPRHRHHLARMHTTPEGMKNKTPLGEKRKSHLRAPRDNGDAAATNVSIGAEVARERPVAPPQSVRVEKKGTKRARPDAAANPSPSKALRKAAPGTIVFRTSAAAPL